MRCSNPQRSLMLVMLPLPLGIPLPLLLLRQPLPHARPFNQFHLNQFHGLCNSSPPPTLLPPVDSRPYQQRKHALLYTTDPLPSVIHLGKYNAGSYQTVGGFSELSEAEQLLLARRLKAKPWHVIILSVCCNYTHQNAQLELAEAISSMTALQMLDLSGEAPCFVVLRGVCFGMRERVLWQMQAACESFCAADSRCRKRSQLQGRCCCWAIADRIDSAADAKYVG